MKELRIVAVDDERLALRRLKLLLQGIPGVQLVAEAASCAEAVMCVRRTNPDLLLLDIKMADGDGFTVIDALAGDTRLPMIIFVSAFDHFAVRAFEHAALDYLLKPVGRERLRGALARARQVAQSRDAEQRLLEMQEVVRSLRSAAASRTESPYLTEVWLRGPDGHVRLPLESIECVSSEDDYVALHTAGGAHLMRGSLTQFETKVEPGHFVRVHRRWIVRKSAIAQLRTRRRGGAEMMLRSGRKMPVGRVYLKQLRASLTSSGLC